MSSIRLIRSISKGFHYLFAFFHMRFDFYRDTEKTEATASSSELFASLPPQLFNDESTEQHLQISRYSTLCPCTLHDVVLQPLIVELPYS